MKLTTIFSVFLLFFATLTLGAPIPAKGNKKGPNPLNPKNQKVAVQAEAPPVGSLVKVNVNNIATGAAGSSSKAKSTVGKHPAIVLSEPDANGNVQIAQLSHGTNNPFTNFATSSDVIPTLSTTPGFDNRKPDPSRPSVVNVTPGQTANVNDIDNTAFPGLSASQGELQNLQGTIQQVATTNPAPGQVTPVTTGTGGASTSTSDDATDSTSDAQAASSSTTDSAANAATDATTAATDATDGAADAADSGIIGDVESAAKDVGSDLASGAEDAAKSGVLGDLADALHF